MCSILPSVVASVMCCFMPKEKSLFMRDFNFRGNPQTLALCCLVLIACFCSGNARSETFTWGYSGYQYPTALDGCRFAVHQNENQYAVVVDSSIRVHAIYYEVPVRVSCDWSQWYIGDFGIKYTIELTEGLGIFRIGDGCAAGLQYNYTTGTCGHDSSLGKPESLACRGNPISVDSGNKYQKEIDYSDTEFALERFYNSVDGLWRTSFGDRIINSPSSGRLALVKSDGTTAFYLVKDGSLVKDGLDPGELSITNSGWKYLSREGGDFYFDSAGYLYRYVDPSRKNYDISHAYLSTTVSHLSSVFKIDTDGQGQPLSVQTPSGTITYTYDNYRLQSVNKVFGNQATSRQFLYEDSRNPKLLTGIIDERGIKFATWAYDDKGRAVSSQHAGGAGLTQVTYNADGSSTVTNELDKKAVYKFQQIAGINRVTSIEGEPSADCPAANTTYTYNDRGLVLTKTDAKGLVTTYSYNDRGLEISRTEASGTTLERTITTEWDPDRFLPIRILEPARSTVYSYDESGRELSRQIVSQ